MRLVASLLLVAVWIAVAVGALVATVDPQSGQLAEQPAAETGADPGLALDADEAVPAERTDDEILAAVEGGQPEPEADPAASEVVEFGADSEAEDSAGSESEDSPAKSESAIAEPQAEIKAAELLAALPPARKSAAPAEVQSGQDAEAPPLSTRTEPVLSAADRERYRKIFAHQRAGRMKSADGLIAKLENPVLLGHVKAQRYLHPTAYRSSYKELRAWLRHYHDHPEADKIYGLALKKRPAGGVLPKKPAVKKKSLAKLGYITRPPYVSKKKLSRAQRRRVRQLRATVYRRVERRQLTSAEKLIATQEVQKLFDHRQIDEVTAWVAGGWFYLGKSERAWELAAPAAERSGDEVPQAYWLAGISAWRLGDMKSAVRHFEALARIPGKSEWNDTAGAYWAARAHHKLGDAKEAVAWLKLAAEHSRTFYGLLAHRSLGLPLEFKARDWSLDGRRREALMSKPEGERALAFLAIGDSRMAEKELSWMNGWDEPAVADAIMAAATEAKLPALSLKVAKRLLAKNYEGWNEYEMDTVLYPVPPWQPKSGFKVDRALVYAVIRQESQFKRFARSRIGARGLMQLLPSTARDLTKRHSFRGAGRSRLYDPALNMEMGQRYLRHLMRYPYINGDLFRLATAYNGGPGNLRSWTRLVDHDDPLIFIESLPVQETREYIKRVLTNFWVYRAQLGQDAPSLAAAAIGVTPTYEAQDGREPEPETPVAEAEQAEKSGFWSLFGFN